MSSTDQGAVGPRARWRPDPAFGWRAGWLLAVALAALALAVAFPAEAGRVTAAAVAVCIPAVAGLVVRRPANQSLAAILLVLWAVGGACACLLGGGVSGPLAAWCLIPVAAASSLGEPKRMAEGAGLAFMAAAVAAMAQRSGLVLPAPAGEAAFWMGLLCLSSTGVGLGAGLVLAQRRMVRRDHRREGDLARASLLLDGQPQLLVVVSPHGWVRSIHGQTPAGVDRRAVLTHGFLAMVAAGDRVAVAEALRRAAAEGKTQVGFAPAGALERWAVATIARQDDGRLVAVVRDATAEKEHEALLEQAKTNAETLAAGKSRFLANMSHELRTPLNAIMGFSDIMRARMFGPLPDKYAEYGGLIHESGSHLLDLINDVLDMSKIEADRFELNREVFDAREAISAALRLMRLQADAAGVQLRGVLPSTPLEIDADRRALKQIALNLVSNALKFTPKGGSVTVTVHGYEGVFELVVADTGVGISKEDMERLGRPYEQADAGRKVQGTGLGLSLVRSFAELHGGEMIIESTVGEGASVSVRLPVLRPSETGPPDSDKLGENVVVFSPQR